MTGLPVHLRSPAVMVGRGLHEGKANVVRNNCLNTEHTIMGCQQLKGTFKLV